MCYFFRSPPFCGHNTLGIYKSILEANIKFSDYFSEPAKYNTKISNSLYKN